MLHQPGEEEGPSVENFKNPAMGDIGCAVSSIGLIAILLGIVVDLFVAALVILPSATGSQPGRSSSPITFFVIFIVMSICPSIALLCSSATNKVHQESRSGPAIKTIALVMVGFAALIALFA